MISRQIESSVMSKLGSVLVIVAHPDDECLGAGGTIRNHIDAGIPVDVFCLTGNDERNNELKTACDILGVRNIFSSNRDDFDIDMGLSNLIIEKILETRPFIVITHSQDDYNRSHRECAGLVAEAIEWASHKTIHEEAHRVKRIYHMEVNALHTHPHYIVDISNSYDESLLALKAHESQISKANGFYLNLYDTRTRLRGVQGACNRAEAFTISIPTHSGPFYPQNSRKVLI